MWHDNIHAAIQSLHPGASLVHDYAWTMGADGEPFMRKWDSGKLGPLDLAAIEAEALRLASVVLVPTSVSQAQAMVALYNAGLLDRVKTLIENHPYAPIRLWFTYASPWERKNPYLNGLALELDLTDKQIDDLFIAASKL